MIANAVKGKGFRGALEYDLGKEGGRAIDTNMAGSTPRELAAEFGEIRKLRPNLSKAVLHVSLSAAPGERLTDEQWQEIGKRYMADMGLEQNQFIITRHTDTDHEHIHLLANRIRFDGSVTSDSQDYKRQEVIMREVERDFGLQRVTPSIEAERRAPTKGEIEEGIRTGKPSAKQQLQQLCDGAAKGCKSFKEYRERLEAAGVELVPVTQLDGAKLSGLSYRLDSVTMKGSDLGKAYSPAGLAKRGVTYEQDRDFSVVSNKNDRGTADLGQDRAGEWQRQKDNAISKLADGLAEKRTQRERHAPKRELWAEYRSEWKPEQRVKKSVDWAAQRETEQLRRVAIRANFDNKRSALQGNRKLSRAERKAALSVARMEKVLGEVQLRQTSQAERLALKARYQKPAAELYRDFLAEKVEHGNEEALKELRRQRTERATEEESPFRFRSQHPEAAQQAAPILPRMDYSVSRNGDVTYKDDKGRDALKDVGHEVRLLKVDEKTIETGLRFAMQKFGKNIDLTGDSAFKQRTVEIAISRGIDVEFTDPEAKRYHATLKHQKEIDQQHQELGKEFFKQQKAAQTAKPIEQKREREPDRKAPEHEPKRQDKEIDHDR